MNLTEQKKIGSVTVIGGGIGGMQAALDLAESGFKVYLVEKKPSIGGVMSQLDKTFPTNDCAMCTMAPRLVAISSHKDIEVITMADIDKVEGKKGNFKITLTKNARHVDEEKCTGCGVCTSNCPVRNIVQPLERSKVKVDPSFEKVKEIVNSHKNQDGPLMPILQEINATFNYLPENLLKYISQETGYSLSHILHIATFYSSFSIKPRGKNIISVCLGTTCYVRGSERLMEKFSDVLEIQPEETTSDMKFTLKSVRCIGCCSIAPAVMINGKAYSHVKTNKIHEILKGYK
jgi:NADH:ubiquinone oxidoreductase subunit E